MSNVDEILSYKKNPDEDFYALLNCDESSSVSSNEIIKLGEKCCFHFSELMISYRTIQSLRRKIGNVSDAAAAVLSR
jgi:hypothetical protein